MNPDMTFASCDVPQELSDAEIDEQMSEYMSVPCVSHPPHPPHPTQGRDSSSSCHRPVR